MVVPESAAEALRWTLTLLLPLLLAVLVTWLLPAVGMSTRSPGWLRGFQLLGLALVLIGVMTPLVLFPVVVVLMFLSLIHI